MGAIYAGLVSNGSCVFATNDSFGKGAGECAIVKVNRRCGGLVVTTRGNFLRRFIEIWDRNIPQMAGGWDGISSQVAQEIVNSFETGFGQDPAFLENPLPFLLLLVGYDTELSPGIEHIFVRNRVVATAMKAERKQYTTGFEIQPPVPARSLFYGQAELARYWCGLLADRNLDLPEMKLLACFSLAETQKLDTSIYPGIRMATLSEGEGFTWIGEDELRGLSELAGRAERNISEGMSECFAQSETSGDADNRT